MAVVTNGAACLQREKLAASGLERHFDAVVVSGELGVGKPDPSVFRHALELLGADGGVMIGDSLDRDIDGALAAGLDAVWINRFGSGPGRDGVPEISSLAELRACSAERVPVHPAQRRADALLLERQVREQRLGERVERRDHPLSPVLAEAAAAASTSSSCSATTRCSPSSRSTTGTMSGSARRRAGNSATSSRL